MNKKGYNGKKKNYTVYIYTEIYNKMSFISKKKVGLRISICFTQL